MTIHNNPRTTPYSRAEIVRRVMGISERAVAKWLARFRAEGEAGMTDRSSRPHAMPSATPADVVEQVIALRLQRLRGKQIAKGLGLSPVTATRVVTDKRLVLQKLRLPRRLQGPRPQAHPHQNLHLQTNGRAERFVQTSLREWAYARVYPTSEHRKAALEPWLHNYYWHRRRGSLNSMPPISRLNQPTNNLLGLHS